MTLGWVRVEVEEDAAAVAWRGAALIAEEAREAIEARGSCAIAVSGGRTPLAMFAALANEDVPWASVGIWQVDERIAPRGHDDRGLTHLTSSLPTEGLDRLHPMPVDDLDPADDDACAAAAAAYAAGLPATFDLIHLGLGDDGHTASLVPGDPVLEVFDRDVAITGGVFRGRRRMTLTYPTLDRGRRVLWIVTGADKARPFARVVARDRTIPAGRVAATDQLAIVDRAAGALARPA
jgi:6-phosphogluconolactonase